MPKYTRFGGKNLPVPLIYGNPQGRSASFSDAQTNKDPSQITDFVLTRVSDYGLASIDNETMMASMGDANAFMEAATTEIDGAIQAVTRSLAVAMFRDGSGTIGRVANSNLAQTTVTLTELDEITNFEVGMTLQLSSAGTIASLRTTAQPANDQVLTIDRGAGTFTIGGNISTVYTSAAQNDFINVEGDLEAKVSGLDAWIPASAPTSTLFFGVDRSADSTRLGGVRVAGAALPIEEALIEGASKVGREGGSPDHCFMNFEKYSDLEKALGSKVQYVDLRANAEIAFRGILINGPKGPIRVIPDQNCLPDVAFMLQMNMWKLYSLGDAPMILDSDGNKMLREASADAVEVRTGYYGQLGSRAPGYNARVTLS